MWLLQRLFVKACFFAFLIILNFISFRGLLASLSPGIHEMFGDMRHWFHCIVLKTVPVPEHHVYYRFPSLKLTQDASYHMSLDPSVAVAPCYVFCSMISVVALLIRDSLSVLVSCFASWEDFGTGNTQSIATSCSMRSSLMKAVCHWISATVYTPAVRCMSFIY